MKVKALTSFVGIISMYKGEERTIENKEVLEDLLSSNYIEELKPKKGGKRNED